MHRMYRACMHTIKTPQQIKPLMNDYPSKNANYLTIHHLPTFSRDAYMISFNRHTLPSTHTLTSDQSVHDLPLWILTGRPTDPLFGDREYRVPRPYSPPTPPPHPRASQQMICAPSLYARGHGSEPIRGVRGTILRILNGAGDQVILLFWQDYGALTQNICN